ncbi:hypothetical protein HDU96_003531 [Phlyctochytrium bullatum]|nr:hypothetical protein HDU96_003531 [Phlyctochytrium bullatum]
MDRDNSKPSIVLHYHNGLKELVAREPIGDERRLTADELLQRTVDTFCVALNDVCKNPRRLIYAMTSRVFTPKAVRPLGGRSPEYLEYDGDTPEDLLEFILAKAIEPPRNGRGRKKVEAGECLQFVVREMNDVIKLHLRECKDELDNLLLSGMTKTGHIELGNRIIIPEDLRHGSLGIFHLFIVPVRSAER